MAKFRIGWPMAISGPPQAGGYEFVVGAEVHTDLFDALSGLVQRMRRGLARRHLRESAESGWEIAECLVRARVTSDVEQDDRVPLLVIDGREVSWEAFGKMLMTYEGFEFKLELNDRTDEEC